MIDFNAIHPHHVPQQPRARMIHNLADIGTGDLGYYGESPCSWRVNSWGNGRFYLVHENGTSTKCITTQEAADQNWLWWREEQAR